MKILRDILKTTFSFKKPHLQKALGLLGISVIANHLTQSDHFPLSDSYNFPLYSIITTMVIGTAVMLIAERNFKRYKNKYFLKQLNVRVLGLFLLSTLGYIVLIYIPVYYIFGWIIDADYQFYYLLTGLVITLMLSLIFIVVMFAQDIYDLHKLETIEGKLSITKGGKRRLITYKEIGYFFSEDKVVYVLLMNGDTLATDFSLNEIESNTNIKLFFRANRQTFLHARAVDEIEKIENGKLSVSLKPGTFGKNISKNIISRYKKQEFIDWFEHKL
ncbi:hypothetical protein AWE51_00440 [Aquimarina aggregata]|uniref:HTH LytTR-type domain-containing protein n=1 Tax=Aquimarina aggregata TaxID=1642818 RepID=A0A163C0E8_9FLAO|nr:LytTR family DNA-binding domain-containing protein [Aquimarina aggregata]KZS41945.1 hypothetical protein AWE51_00440 [Aquimarina aggregata]